MTINKKEEYLIYKLADNMKGCVKIDADLFRKLDVKRGLRNEDGTGVLVGLTNIANGGLARGGDCGRSRTVVFYYGIGCALCGEFTSQI